MSAKARISELRKKIADLEWKIQKIMDACDHEYREHERDGMALTYTVVTTECEKCGQFKGCYQKRRKYLDN